MIALLGQWPSVAELLPRYPMIWDAVAGTSRYPHDLPLERLRPLAKRGFALHEEIEQAWRAMPHRCRAPGGAPVGLEPHHHRVGGVGRPRAKSQQEAAG